MFRQSPKILIVDDEIHILYVLAYRLKTAGYEVISASDGVEALELAQIEKPDVIITDYRMPRLSGLEMTRRLRQSPDTESIPVLLLTARGYALDPHTLQELNIEKCIYKPFSSREVIRHVEHLLSPLTV
ncbi:MAG: response regulator [Sedimentisphaerales bacterium]|nr:response regulator [Sedimentisphaerales bacterium]